MKLWVVGASAVRDGQAGGGEVPFTIGYAFAESGDEASEKAWKLARDHFPDQQGWTQHNICVGAVSKEDVSRLVALTLKSE